MLTDTIMYDCVEYLLHDKTDEESLECLCKLLTNIGKELDAKANEKVCQTMSLIRVMMFFFF
jgi:translation initiation factor 4G